jgi:Flp pilus assembly protein TadD
MNNDWKSLATGALFIALLTVTAYLPVQRGDFSWDDDTLITDNRMIKAGDGLRRFWFTTEAADYYPLTQSLWWLEWRLWGNKPTGYHVINVLLHAVNAILVWLILRRLKIPGAWMAGAVFAIHPVNVATVAWISEQKNTLSMLFYAASIFLYLKFDEKGRWRWFGLSVAAFLLALFSKSAVAMLPVALLGCVWWTRGRLQRKDFPRSIPFFALSLIFGLVTIWFQYNRALGASELRKVGFLYRLAAAGWAPWFYLYKAVLPFNLTVIYPKWTIDASNWISYVPGLVLVGCLMLFWHKRTTWGRPLLFGFGYFVVTLFPILGFFDQGFYVYSLVADHWQYYSIIGVIALVVGAVAAISRRMGETGRFAGLVGSTIVLMVLGAATWGRAGLYADNEALWRDNVLKNQNAWLAYNSLANAQMQDGRADEAIGHFEQALQLKPDYAKAHDNLGVALAQSGRTKEAIAHLEQAVRIDPDLADAHDNLGNALLQAGRTQEAIGQYEQALRLRPDWFIACNNLGNALSRAGRLDEAILQYERALRIDPDYAEGHNNLGVVLVRSGKTLEATAQFEQALRIKPDYIDAQKNLARMRAAP